MVESTIKKVTIENVIANDAPRFVKTQLVEAKREGKLLYWEMVKSMDSVHILVDNTETRELMLVRQVRIPVLANDPESNGQVIELCAGLVDKNKDLTTIVAEEVEEEMGYRPNPDSIKHIKSLKSSVGTAGTNSHVYFVQVNESMKVSEGGGLEEEDIEIVRIPYNEVGDEFEDFFVTDAVTMFMLQYWKIYSGFIFDRQ